jgi:protein-tyrosine phosphatase
MLRTSETDPLEIASVDVGACRGKIGITFAPGKNDRFAIGGPWARDLARELDVIVDWGARALVTLLERQELA